MPPYPRILPRSDHFLFFVTWTGDDGGGGKRTRKQTYCIIATEVVDLLPQKPEIEWLVVD
jgi:hypothetical protein